MLFSHVDVCCISEAPACFIKVDVRGSWFFARLYSITSLDFITSKLATQKSEGRETQYIALCDYRNSLQPSRSRVSKPLPAARFVNYEHRRVGPKVFAVTYKSHTKWNML